MHQVCPPHVSLVIFLLGIWLEISLLEPPSCHTRFDTLTWCCKHSFYLDLYLSFDLLYVLLPIECMLLIAVFSCLKRAFVLIFLCLIFPFFCGIPLFHEHTTERFSVKLSCVRCVDALHSQASILYLVRVVFFMPNVVGEGGFSYFVCETLLKGLLFCWQIVSLRLSLWGLLLLILTFLPTCFCTLCCSTAVFWWNLRYLIWSTCCSVLPESVVRKIFFLPFIFCKLFCCDSTAVYYVLLSCLFTCLSCPVFHFWWQAFFIFLWYFFSPISPGRWEAVIFCL